MATFEDIFNGVELSNNQKIEHVRSWLHREYNIKAKDQNVLLALVEVHTHDSSVPQHFGHPLVSSGFGQAIFQLVFATGRWHLSFRRPNSANFILIHPKSEAQSWLAPDNRKAVLEAEVILKSGSLKGETPQVDPSDEAREPKVVVNGSNFELHLPEIDEAEAFGVNQRGYDMGLPSDRSGRIVIDLGSLGGNEK